MNNEIIYLDNCSTTKVCDEAINSINDALKNNWGNPSSLHKKGFDAQILLENSRKTIADFIDSAPQNVYFTPGGTYSNNMAILGIADKLKHLGNRIITTQIEHSSVLGPIEELKKLGFEVIYLKPDNNGFISKEQVFEAVNKDTCFISMMMINNEIGSILPVNHLKDILKSKNPNGIIHVDAIQAFGKVPINVKKLKADFISFSGHKIHGPKGVGALYVSPNVKLKPIIWGGGQGNLISPGTEATPAIAGFSAAVSAIPNLLIQYENIKKLHEYATKNLTSIDGVSINSNVESSPFILNFSAGRIKSETMINYLSANNLFVSGGSACSKGKQSYVLKSMGLPSDRINSAIRISFSRFTTKSQIDILTDNVRQALAKIKHF